jgi:hypothetical protein
MAGSRFERGWIGSIFVDRRGRRKTEPAAIAAARQSAIAAAGGLALVSVCATAPFGDARGNRVTAPSLAERSMTERSMTARNALAAPATVRGEHAFIDGHWATGKAERMR